MTAPLALPAVKTCIRCGDEYSRPTGTGAQSGSTWARRVYCSNACHAADKNAKAEAWRATQTKKCQKCGETYTRPAKLSQPKWDARTACTRTCMAPPRATALCVICNTPFKRRDPKSRTCSRACSTTLANLTRGRDSDANNKEPAVRIRSDKLPKDAPRRLWLEATATGVDVCCGHCLRRFPRATIRQAENLRDLHRRYCKPVVRVSAPWGNGRTWTEAEDDVVRTSSIADAALATGRTVASIEHRRKKLRSPDAPKPPRLWTPEEDAVLAEIPDATEAALKLGRSRMSVVQRRIRLAKAAT